MKKYPALLALLALCISLYSCKKDKDTIPDPSDVYLTKWVFNATDDNPQIWLMTYDDQKRMTSISEDKYQDLFTYNSDGTLFRIIKGTNYYDEYHYQGGVLQYSAIFDAGNPSMSYDTTFYEFDGNGLLTRKIFPNQIDVYAYNSNNQVKMHVKQYMSGSQLLHVDTTLFEWNAQGNLAKETLISTLFTIIKTYSYDDRPNYFSALRYPKEYAITADNTETFQLSVNNCQSITSALDGQTVTSNFDIIGYNSWGYPTKISDENDNVMEFTYEKF